MLTPSRHWIHNLAIVGLLVVLYGGMFLFLYPRIGFAGAPFAAAAVVTAAWLFGPRGGIFTGVLIGCENILLSILAGYPMSVAALRQGLLAGIITLIVLGVAVGHMGNLDRKVKEYATQLQHQAFHDPLTKLPNRALFSDRLEHATARVARGATLVAVLFLDLDGFKRVNDHHGHAVGDLLLQAAAKRMQESVRVGDTVARLGGDEFVVLLEDLDGPESARTTADRLSNCLRQPFVINGTTCSISVSIGIAFCGSAGHRSEDILRDADRAMYLAKASGSGRFEVSRPLVA